MKKNNIFPKAQQEEGQSQQEQLMQVLRNNPQLMKKYQQELTKMQSQTKGKNSYQQPITSKEYAQKLKADQIQQLLDSEGGIVVKPDQAFVLKFLDKRSGQKIFVNIVSHQAVDHPQQKQLIDFDNQTGLRIPMSMSTIKEDRDKSGNVCKVVDVIMNPKIIATAEANPDILQFMTQIIANYLLQKHKIAKVKGLKYKGSTVELQRVKGRKAPKIEQVSQQQMKEQKEKKSEQERLFNEINGQFDHEKKVSRPEFRIYVLNVQGEKQEFSFDTFKKQNTSKLFIILDLSLLIHSRGIHLEGSSNFMYLSVKGFYAICLKMPVQIQSFKATFGRNQRKLLVQAKALRPKIENDSIQTKDGAVNFSVLSSQKPNQKNKVVDVQFENDLLDQLV